MAPRGRHSRCPASAVWNVLCISILLLTLGSTWYIGIPGVGQWCVDSSNKPGTPTDGNYWIADSVKSLREGAELRILGDHTEADGRLPTILILTPLKNATKHLQHYIELVTKLTYPHDRISFGFLDSDSPDAPPQMLHNEFNDVLEAGGKSGLLAKATGEHLHVLNEESHTLRNTATLDRLLYDLQALTDFRSVTISQHDFGLHLDSDKKKKYQLERRIVLAQSRNHLLSSALRDESYVLWVDVDVFSYPENVIETLLSSKKQIVVPRCVVRHNGQSYDLNSWRAPNTSVAVNATLEQVIRYHDGMHARMVAAGKPRALMLEGYGETGNQYMHEMLGEGDVVRLDAVGGAMLLVDAELHRKGLIFPPFAYRHRIETEGLSMMALDMGVMSYGMPNVEIIHKLRAKQ